MHIVVLDAYTLNPGDLSWNELRQLAKHCDIYERTTSEQLLERAACADILLTNKTELKAEHIAQLPKLRYIGVLATGYNVVDIAAANARGIPVCNVPSYGSSSVAQMVFALLLQMLRQPQLHNDSVHAGDWSAQADFCYWKTPQLALEEVTLGLIGLGAIGREVARLAQAFGMPVLAYTRTPGEFPGVEYLDLEELLRRSDVISLHCPLTSNTAKLINQHHLSLMKANAYLINTSRGGLVDEDALAAALHQGHLAGAALDVLSTEPPSPNNPLLTAPRCLITPHIAWATRRARHTLLSIAIKNIQAFINGKVQNSVSA